MHTKGLEIARVWFFFCLLNLVALFMISMDKWQPVNSARDMWYFIPETFFVALMALRMGVAILTVYWQLPGCNCVRASALYQIGSNITYPEGRVPFCVRLPPILCSVAGVFCLVVLLISLVAKITTQTSALRIDNLVALGLMSFLLFAIQSTHYVCLIYYNGMLVEGMQTRVMVAVSSIPEQLEDVVVMQGPADVSAYKVTLTESMQANYANCPICSEALEVGLEVVKLPCTHVFHEVCSAVWIGNNPSCPICRSTVSVPYMQGPSAVAPGTLDQPSSTQPMVEGEPTTEEG